MPTILIIDDDISALSSLAVTLEGAGYQIQRASSVDHARQLLDDSEPDLILLEVDTSRGVGWDLLRDIVRFEGPPTIVVTHRAREDEVVQALTIGAVDVLPKPFRSSELLARVRARLGQPPIAPASEPPPPRPDKRRVVEEPVFMAHADEEALLKMRSPSVDIAIDDPSLPLGARLRAGRQQRRLTLVQVNLETKIPIWYLQAMEEEKFALLPRGPAAADLVRVYADYLRLDTPRILAEYRSRHDISPFKPLPSLGGAASPRDIPPWVGIVVALLLALAIGVGVVWFVLPDQVTALRTNLRSLVVRPTVTPTLSPTIPATLTVPLPTPTP